MGIIIIFVIINLILLYTIFIYTPFAYPVGNAFSSRVGVARPICGGPEFPVALVLAEDWDRDCWIAEAIALDSVPIFTVTVSLVRLESAITGHALHAANQAGRTNDCEMCARANRRIVIFLGRALASPS